MVAANLRLVESVARKFHGRGLSHWELCQVHCSSRNLGWWSENVFLLRNHMIYLLVTDTTKLWGSCRRVLSVSWRALKSLMAIAEPSFPPMLSSGSKRWVLFLLGYSLLSVSPNCGSLLSLCLELRCLLVQGQSKMEWSLSSQAYCTVWMRVLNFFCCYNVSWVLARIMTWVILFHSTTEVFTHCIQDLTPQFVTLQRMAAAAKKFRHVLRIGRPVYQTASLILQQKDVSSWISCTLFRSV